MGQVKRVMRVVGIVLLAAWIGASFLFGVLVLHPEYVRGFEAW